MRAVALILMRSSRTKAAASAALPGRQREAAALMEQGPWDPALLTELSDLMRDASICGLARRAQSVLCV